MVEAIDEARQYAENHRKWAGLMYGNFPKYVTSLGPIRSCLEVGSGPGTLAVMVAKSNPELQITAVDISADMIAVAEDHIRENKLQDRIRCVWGDAAGESLVDHLGKFDLVYSFYSLHLWENSSAVLKNLMKMLGHNGLLYIFDMRRVWWANYVPFKSNDIDAIRSAYTSEEVDALLRASAIRQYEIRKKFPFFQSVTVTQQTS